MILQDGYCEICCNQYTDIFYRWCKPCNINYLKKNFANWTSGNEKIDDLIQEIQLQINDPQDIVFEWIPYDQFNNIKVIGEGGFAKVYSATWKHGPLYYDYKNEKNEYTRNKNKEIALKCLYNSQNTICHLQFVCSSRSTLNKNLFRKKKKNGKKRKEKRK